MESAARIGDTVVLQRIFAVLVLSNALAIAMVPSLALKVLPHAPTTRVLFI